MSVSPRNLAQFLVWFLYYVRNFYRILQDTAFNRYLVLTHCKHLPYCHLVFCIKDPWLPNLLGALPFPKLNVILFHVNVIYKKQNRNFNFDVWRMEHIALCAKQVHVCDGWTKRLCWNKMLIYYYCNYNNVCDIKII